MINNANKILMFCYKLHLVEVSIFIVMVRSWIGLISLVIYFGKFLIHPTKLEFGSNSDSYICAKVELKTSRVD